MQIITRLALFSCLTTLAACPGGGDDTGTGTGASTAGSTGPGTTSPTSGATEATTGPTSGATSTTGPGTTGPGTTGPGTTGPGTTTEATTEPGTTTEASTSTTTSGSTSEGSTTGGMGGGVCQTDADCKLHVDCCSCYGIPKDQNDPICKAACEKSKCEQAGIDQAVCRFGQCTTEKVKCSGEVACDSLPPNCPPGELPGKTDACWTGGCVPAASCDAVDDCSQCPDSTMCVEYQTLLQQWVCEPIPEACEGAPNCACAGDLACTDEFTACNDGNGDTDLVCICPAC